MSLLASVRKCLLLAGDADVPRFSTLSVDSSQQPTQAQRMLCLHVCVSVWVCRHVCVCVFGGEWYRERVAQTIRAATSSFLSNLACDTLQNRRYVIGGRSARNSTRKTIWFCSILVEFKRHKSQIVGEKKVKRQNSNWEKGKPKKEKMPKVDAHESSWSFLLSSFLPPFWRKSTWESDLKNKIKAGQKEQGWTVKGISARGHIASISAIPTK